MPPPGRGACPAVQLPSGPGPAGLAAQARFWPNRRYHRGRPQKSGTSRVRPPSWCS